MKITIRDKMGYKKIRKTAMIAAACTGLVFLTGCGSQEQKIYKQAESDLEKGSYEAALQGFELSVENGVKLPHSYRGAGIASLRLGNYDSAAEYFTSALNNEKTGKALKKDILSYRASAYLKAGNYEDAMADCQTLAEEYSMDENLYFLTGKTALAMDSYDEASVNFRQAYEKESTYEMAIRIYEAYLAKDMEADGTAYLEAALTSEPKDARDYCDRGRVYYYMEDYENARKELIEASNEGNTEALLLLGMVYTEQKDISNARAMYQEFVNKEEKAARGYNGLALCDIAEGNYDSALSNIETGIALADIEEMQSLLLNEMVVYEKKLDFSTAMEKAREYVEMYPDDRSAAKELAFLQTRTGGAE